MPLVRLTYATVFNVRPKGRAVKVEQTSLFGTAVSVGAALANSASSRAINPQFVERQDGTKRNRNAGKIRKTYIFIEPK